MNDRNTENRSTVLSPTQSSFPWREEAGIRTHFSIMTPLFSRKIVAVLILSWQILSYAGADVVEAEAGSQDI